jgi:hypothetical protein
MWKSAAQRRHSYQDTALAVPDARIKKAALAAGTQAGALAWKV